MTSREVVIEQSDMSAEMQRDVLMCTALAMNSHKDESDIAAYIKKDFDRRYNPYWHCFVGRHFGSYCTHETNCYINFKYDDMSITLFKSP